MKEELPNPGHLMTQIAEFLSSPVTSNDGGYAPVGDTDWLSLNQIIDALIMLKWGPDSDGDRPVNFRLVNRHNACFTAFPTLPYSGPNLNSALHLLRDAMSMQSEAAGKVREAVDTAMMFMPTVYAVVDDENTTPLERKIDNLREAINGGT